MQNYFRGEGKMPVRRKRLTIDNCPAADSVAALFRNPPGLCQNDAEC